MSADDSGITAWINRQDWSDEIKAQAHAVVDSRSTRGQYPMTGSGWVEWAKAHGVEANLTTTASAEETSVLDDLTLGLSADEQQDVRDVVEAVDMEADRWVTIPAAHLQDLRDIAAALETYQTDPLNVNHNAMAAKLREIAGES